MCRGPPRPIPSVCRSCIRSGNYIDDSRYGLIPTLMLILLVGYGLLFSASSSASMPFAFNASTRAHDASLESWLAPLSVAIYTPVITPKRPVNCFGLSICHRADCRISAIRSAKSRDSLFCQYGMIWKLAPANLKVRDIMSVACLSEIDRAASLDSSEIILLRCPSAIHVSDLNNNMLNIVSNTTPHITMWNATRLTGSQYLSDSNIIPIPSKTAAAISASSRNGLIEDKTSSDRKVGMVVGLLLLNVAVCVVVCAIRQVMRQQARKERGIMDVLRRLP